MKKYYLAIDIGASSGRHILGEIENGKLQTEEIYRFENNIKTTPAGICWDIESLVVSVIAGIARCAEIGKIPASVAIDTWGVDYVLLDAAGEPLLPVFAYRDSRTTSVPDDPDFPFTYEELYGKTGIQRQAFNTVYQLYCDKRSGKIDAAKHFLMIPDYLAYRLTGVMTNEYTNATTTAMVGAKARTWDSEILGALGLDPALFLPPVTPGSVIGTFTPAVTAAVGFEATVLAAPTHDTASAVAACPVGANSLYISSGTWSLMGRELSCPILTDAAREANFTNEGGVEYRYRFLKNIMGMWLLQNVRRNLDKKYSYDQMMHMAMQSTYRKVIDVNHESLVCPENMILAVARLAGDEGLPLGDVLSCIYHSLAAMYGKTVTEIEAITGTAVDRIYILGGGSRDSYLNALTEQYTGKEVIPSLGEATATGNLLSQIMKDQNISLTQARKLVGDEK